MWYPAHGCQMYHSDGSNIKLIFRALRSMLVVDVFLHQPMSHRSDFSFLYLSHVLISFCILFRG